MGENKVFFSQQLLDNWIVSQEIQIIDNDLLLNNNGKQFRYRLCESALVTEEVTGNPDIHKLVGKCKSLKSLRVLGADILQGSMIIGENAYNVVPGFLGSPISRSKDAPGHTREVLCSDEELLAMFLANHM